MDDTYSSEVIIPKCRICTISSECFNYFDIFEKKIFNNIIVKDAVILITQLQISIDDGYPKWICCRCEQRLLDAYQFRKLAESSANQFAATISATTRRRVIKSEQPITLNKNHGIGGGGGGGGGVAATNEAENEVIDMIVYCSKSDENNDEEQHNFNIVTGEDEDLVSVEYLNDSGEPQNQKTGRSESISPFSGFDEQSVNKFEYNYHQQQKNHEISNTVACGGGNVDDDYNNMEMVSIHDDDNNVGLEITVMSTQTTPPPPPIKNVSSSNKMLKRYTRKPTPKREILTPRLSNRTATIKKRTPTKETNVENDPMTVEKIKPITVNSPSNLIETKKRTPPSRSDTGAIDAVEYLIQKVEDLKQDGGNVVRKLIKNQRQKVMPLTPTSGAVESTISKTSADTMLEMVDIAVQDLKRKHSCQVCAKRFVGKSNLIDHLRYHANVKPFKCDMCDRAFVQIGTLKSHLRTHTKEKPFVCHICQKAFSQNCSLKIHLRKHTQERNYLCQVCQKTFMSHCDLAKHSRIHDPSKHYPCQFCPKKFTQNCNLKKHIKSMHSFGTGGDNTEAVKTPTPPKKIVPKNRVK